MKNKIPRKRKVLILIFKFPKCFKYFSNLNKKKTQAQIFSRKKKRYIIFCFYQNILKINGIFIPKFETQIVPKKKQKIFH